MRLVAWCVIGASLWASFASCGRVEEPPPPRAEPAPNAEPTPARAATPPSGAQATATTSDRRAATAPQAGREQSGARDAGRCVVETPTEPPPHAQRAARCPPDPEGVKQLAIGRITFVDAKGKPHIDVELAREPDQRSRGLMYRTSMPEGHGMLFSWEGREQQQTFWMHNTCIPLDMLFVASDGTITGILEQVPTLNDDPRTIPCPVAHVLEVNAGYCRRHGVVAGQKLRIEP